MRVQDMMTRRVQTITGAEPVSAAVERMRRSRIRHLVVMRDGELAGIVSSGDMRALDLRRDRRVEEIMTAPAVTATPGMTMRKAANLLRGRSIGCLPVVEDGSLVGIVTTSDLLERIGRGVEPPVSPGKRWILKGRGPRRKSVVGRKDFAGR
jgi:acetoin utilization protein AcuB